MKTCLFRTSFEDVGSDLRPYSTVPTHLELMWWDRYWTCVSGSLPFFMTSSWTALAALTERGV